MVAISLYGSGEGSGWVTAPGYSTPAFWALSLSVPARLERYNRKLWIEDLK